MTAPSPPASPRARLADLYWSAVNAAAPGPALSAALARHIPDPARRVHIIALGKAAHPMAVAAVAALHERGLAPAGGLLVSPSEDRTPDPALKVAVGDHPEPGPASTAAALELEKAAARVQPSDEVWVLLSGGATSLLGSPIVGVTPDDLAALYRSLLGSGLDISAMNRIRKRFSRWGAGRLAARLRPARVKNFTISDVIGDDLASIGSGPCVPDEATAAEVRSLLTSAGLWEKIPDAFRRILLSVERGEAPETPKPGDPAFENMQVELVASNRLALMAVVSRAETLGLEPQLIDSALAGEASAAGRRIATALAEYEHNLSGSQGVMHKDALLIWGGETTVTLGSDAGRGGRSQELALSAAQVLSAKDARTVTLLAAGTDGRDGPTDAAGAVVDAATWDAIRAAGRDPAKDLASHSAYDSLQAADALFKTGMTGTNVMDLVLGLVAKPQG